MGASCHPLGFPSFYADESSVRYRLLPLLLSFALSVAAVSPHSTPEERAALSPLALAYYADLVTEHPEHSNVSEILKESYPLAKPGIRTAQKEAVAAPDWRELERRAQSERVRQALAEFQKTRTGTHALFEPAG